MFLFCLMDKDKGVTMNKVELLKKIYLFKELTVQELETLSQVAEEKSFIAGQELFFSGQPSDCLYVVAQGAIKILKSNDNADELDLIRLESGEHFGEMGYLTREPRTATAQTLESSMILSISYDRLEEILKNHISISEKFHRAIARFLAKRLKATTVELMSRVK